MKYENPNDAFCGFEWRQYLPEELQAITDAEWLAKSRQSNWAPYFKLLGERSPATFRKSDIVAWFRLKFGVVRPDCLQALLDAGYEPASVSSFKKTRKKRVRIP